MSTTQPTFKKTNKVKILEIPGCKTSLKNNQLLTSTGVPSLDNILGGGVAIGTLLLIEEDTYHNYSDVILRYFLSQSVICHHDVFVSAARQTPSHLIDGDYSDVIVRYFLSQSIVCHHNVFVSAARQKPSHLIDSMPAVVEDTISERGDDAKMSIAWRYQDKPSIPSGAQGTTGHSYDLTKIMPRDKIDAVNISSFDPSESQDSYKGLLKEIHNTIESGGYSTHIMSPHRNVLRIAIQSLACPLWPTTPTDITLPQFLYALRALLRYSFTVAMITIPSHLLTYSICALLRYSFTVAMITMPSHLLTPQTQQTVRRLSDTAIKLDSFDGSDRATNPLYKDYHGLLQVVKRPCLNSLTYQTPQAEDLAFKLRRKKFTIEKLHLPPELSETPNRTQGQSLGGCGPGSQLDF